MNAASLRYEILTQVQARKVTVCLQTRTHTLPLYYTSDNWLLATTDYSEYDTLRQHKLLTTTHLFQHRLGKNLFTDYH